jgi:hypothetical protein
MPRLTIIFCTDVFNQLQESATQKQIPVAHYARTLVDIGSRVEEAAAKKKRLVGRHKKNIPTHVQAFNCAWNIRFYSSYGRG